jgi:hypothetical protein
LIRIHKNGGRTCQGDRGSPRGGAPPPPPAAQSSSPPAGTAPAAFDSSRSDRRAIDVADRMMVALGGPEAWSATRYIYFTFALKSGEDEITRRTHLWDKGTGRHRVEGVDNEGRRYVLIHLVGDPAMLVADIDGEKITDVQLLLGLKEQATALWTNDTYWLLMPYKLKDPGVILAYDGEVADGGQTYDVVRLSFDHVGMTPGDHYWAYVNRQSGLMDRWAFHLQNMDASAEPVVVAWTNWRRYGRIMLSDARPAAGGGRQVYFPDLAVYDELPDSVFTSIAPLVLPGL